MVSINTRPSRFAHRPMSDTLASRNYRRHAIRLNFPVDRRRQADLSTFPIEEARMQIGVPILLLGAAGAIGYGWLLEHRVSVAGPILMLFLLGYTLTAGFQALNILMIDIYPGQAATATAANNVCRCLLGAAASAAIIPMSEAVGFGWAYTILSLLFVGSTVALIPVMRSGMRWRRVKKDKAEKKQVARELKESQIR